MSLSSALTWLENQLIPIYRPVAGASVTPDAVYDENAIVMEGDFTPPTGATSSPLRVQMTSPTPSSVHPSATTFAGTIEGTVADCTPTSSAGTPLNSVSISPTPDVDGLINITGHADGVSSGTTHRVHAYVHTNTYILKANTTTVDASGNWAMDIPEAGGADWRFRLIRISDGKQIGAEWNNATKDWPGTEVYIDAFLYEDVYYHQQQPDIPYERQYTDVLVDPADITIFSVAVTGSGPYTISGGTHITTAGTHQIRATNSSTLVGYFNVAADGTWSLTHADNDLSHWLFELVVIATSALVGTPWTTTATYPGRWKLDALGFGNGWRFQLKDVATDTVQEAEWQSVNGNADVYDGLEIRLASVTDRDYWIRRHAASVTDRWYFKTPIGRKAIRIHLTTDEDNPALPMPAPQAEWTMSNGLPRSYIYLSGDPQYDTRSEYVSFTYDAAIAIVAFLSVSDWTRARQIALGLIGVQFTDGAFPFAAFQRYSQASYDRILRTGAIAWVAYALLKCKQMLPPAYQDPSIAIAALHCLSYLESLADSTGMLRGGEGQAADAWVASTAYTVGDRATNADNVYEVITSGTSAGSGGPTGTGTNITDGTVHWKWIVAGSVDPVAVTFHSTEHNVDAWAAFNLAYTIFGLTEFRDRASAIRQGLLAYHWNTADGYFYQGSDIDGVPDGVSSLDSGSWGGIMLINWGETAKATSAIMRLDAHYVVTHAGHTGYRTFSEDDGVTGYSALWPEGTFGVALARQRLGDAAGYSSIVSEMAANQEADGGFLYVMDPDPGITDPRENIGGPAWYIMGAHPDVIWAETIATPLASRRFIHAEVWTDLECAGGVLQAIIAAPISITVHRAVVSEQHVELSLARNSSSRAALDYGRVLTLRYDDGSAEEWRVTKIVDTESTNGLITEVSAVHPVMDLAEYDLLREVRFGIPSYEFGAVDLTPLEYVTNFILPQCPSYVSLGRFDSDVLLSLTFSRATPFGGLMQIVDAVQNLRIALEFDYRRVGTTHYAIDFVSAIGQDAPEITLIVGTHITELQESGDATDQTTKVQSFGANSTTMGRAAWVVTVISSTELELSDEEQGGASPILVDDQLNGLYIVNPTDGTLLQITDTVASTRRITVSDTSDFTDNDLVEFRADASGTQLDALSLPGQRVKFGFVVDESLEGLLNLVRNAFMSEWNGPDDGPPDRYSFFNHNPGYPSGMTPTIMKVTGPPFPDFGFWSAHIVSGQPFATFGTGSSQEVGFLPETTRWITVTPDSRFTLSARIWINSVHTYAADTSYTMAQSRVRLQLERVGITDPEYNPVVTLTTDDATVFGEWIDLSIENIILPASGRYKIRLKEFMGFAYAIYGTFDVYVNAFQLTETIEKQPWIEGSAGTRLWHLANYQLNRAGSPTKRYSATVIDFARLDLSRFGHLRLARGGACRVISQVTGLDIQTRILEFDEDVIGSAVVQLTLATQPSRLTQLLASSVSGL